MPRTLDGSKTITHRPSRLTVRVRGGTYYIRVNFFSYLPEKVRVKRIYMQRLGDMTEDGASWEWFASLGDFMED